ncbi:MAG: rRNA maturation RNase YbeY [Thiomicrospira sp.]|jgi:probable rRNA maturation factor|nr:rRNA maturation RNase YbeY [Thiomicrospira sp.]
MVDVELQWAIEPQAIPTEAQCQKWAQAAMQGEYADKPVALTIRVVDADEGRNLNQTYRQKDYATNVLSFDFEYPAGLQQALLDEDDEPLYLGDLVMCASVIIEEAMAQEKTLEEHWAHLVVHGCLHLQGYDHIEEAQAEAMEALETRIMQQLGYDDPY